MAKLYMLTDINRKIGVRHNTWIYDLTWLDPDTLVIYMMIVDESFRNYSKWDTIIQNDMLGLYSGLRRTNRVDQDLNPVMSADSTPQLVEILKRSEITKYVELRQQELYPTMFL